MTGYNNAAIQDHKNKTLQIKSLQKLAQNYLNNSQGSTPH